MAQHLWYDTTKARQKLGLEPTPIEDSIRRSLAWFKREGYIESR
jgi:nucleoside-diphosphate-sugar epimerase